MKRIFTLLIFVSLYQISSAQVWNTKAVYGGAARSLSSSFSIPKLGKGFVVGGSDWSYLNDVWAYDTLSDSWSQMANFPGLPDAHVAFNINDTGYVGTGVSGGYQWSNAFYKYDPIANTWITKATFPGVPRGYAVGFAVNGKGYIGGGSHGNNFGSSYDFYEYDPTIDTWTRKSNIPALGGNHCAIGFSINGKGYIGTGSSLDSVMNTETVQQDFWEYDPLMDTWTKKADFGGGTRAGAVGFSTCDKGYVGCGYTNSAQNVRDYDFWQYDPGADTWTRVADMGSTGMAFPSSFTIGKSCFVGNGSTLSNYLNSWYEYIEAGASVLTVTANPTTICSGQSDTLTVVSGVGAYAWSPTTGLTDSTSFLIIAKPLVTTTYSVSSSGGNCAVTGQVVVVVGNGGVGGKITTLRDTLCQGTPGHLYLSGNSSSTIQWQSSVIGSNFSDIPGATDTTNIKTTPLLQSTYYRAEVGTGSCSAISDTLELIVPPPLTASFTSNTNGKMVTFNSSSSLGNINSYYWDFGDNQTGTAANPEHTYSRDTIYSVCLTIYDGSNCSYTFCRDVDLKVNGIPTVGAPSNWNIYPDPFTNELNVEAKTSNSGVQSIEMFDVLGRVMLNKIVGNANNSAYELNVTSLAKGMYYVVIKTADADYVEKVVKQ